MTMNRIAMNANASNVMLAIHAFILTDIEVITITATASVPRTVNDSGIFPNVKNPQHEFRLCGIWVSESKQPCSPCSVQTASCLRRIDLCSTFGVQRISLLAESLWRNRVAAPRLSGPAWHSFNAIPLSFLHSW